MAFSDWDSVSGPPSGCSRCGLGGGDGDLGGGVTPNSLSRCSLRVLNARLSPSIVSCAVRIWSLMIASCSLVRSQGR